MKKNFKLQLMENPVLVIDTETGGFNPKEDALYSVAVILPNGDKLKEWFIYPYDKNYNEDVLKFKRILINSLYTNEEIEKEIHLENVENMEIHNDFIINLLKDYKRIFGD